MWGELRRAIYYIKNLIQDGMLEAKHAASKTWYVHAHLFEAVSLHEDSSGNFSENIEFLAEHGDPQVALEQLCSRSALVSQCRFHVVFILLSRFGFVPSHWKSIVDITWVFESRRQAAGRSRTASPGLLL